MAEEMTLTQAPPETGKSEGEGTVPLNDLIALKKANQRREKDMRGELEATNQRVRELEEELEVMRTNPPEDATEEEIQAVKRTLLQRARQLEVERKKFEQNETSLAKRERDLNIKALSTQYGLSAEDLADAEDPEKTALELYVAKLHKERDALQKKTTTSKYESGTGMTAQKSPGEMSKEEFAKYVDRQKLEASRRK